MRAVLFLLCELKFFFFVKKNNNHDIWLMGLGSRSKYFIGRSIGFETASVNLYSPNQKVNHTQLYVFHHRLAWTIYFTDQIEKPFS